MPRKPKKNKVKKEVEMPKEYIPTSLRPAKPKPREEISYACGYKEGESSYGMFHGPFPVLLDALEIVPEKESPCPYIIRFNLDGTDEELYVWRKDRWVKV